MALAAAAVFVLNNVLASAMFAAVYNFDLSLAANPGALVDRGAAPADLLRVAAVIDMIGYLALGPVVLHMYDRLPGNPRAVTLSGLSAVLAGAIGAVLMASGGPWLLETSTAGAAAQVAARVAFGALENFVLVGLWGTLEVGLLGVWVCGVAWHVRGEGRGFAWLGAVAGIAAFVYSGWTGFTGSLPLGPGPELVILGALGLFPLWLAWLAVRLWRGR